MRPTFNQMLALHFKQHAGEWIDARTLLPIAGFAGWRTRCSELRRAPYCMDIRNRTRRVNGYTVSEYRFVPTETQEAISA